MTNPVMFSLAVGGTWVANKGCDWAVEKADIYAPNTQENLANFIQGVDADISREDAERLAKDLTETAEQALRFGASAAITAAVATGTVPAGKKLLNKQGTGAKVGKKGNMQIKANLNPSQQKSINGLREQISNHKRKLADYIKNPDAFDNRRLLKNANPELRKKIINTLIEKLKKQIETFEKDIQAINYGKKSVLEKNPKQ